MAKEFDPGEEMAASPEDIEKRMLFQRNRLLEQIHHGTLRKETQKATRRTHYTNTIDTTNIGAVLTPLHHYLRRVYAQANEKSTRQ